MKTVVFLLAAVAVALPYVVSADEPPPFPEFTFKRIGVPGAGSANRITVQIDPTVVPEKPVVAQEQDADEVVASLGYDWYWDAVSPSLADTGPGRLQIAMAGLVQAPASEGVSAPPLQHLADIAALHGTDILLATIGKKVSPALVLAMISIESSGRTAAVSHAGARGLMQLMPDTAARFGVTDMEDAAENIRGGVAYLDWLMGEFAGDPVFVLAGYNAGEGAVRNHGGVPPYAETRAYVPKVIAAWDVARGLCLTPPELISDGCVFAVSGRGG